MLKTTKLSFYYGGKKLFENVNLLFSESNCYGIIGANGAGKTTLLKILAKKLEPTSGSVETGSGETISVLEQNHSKFDQFTVFQTVIFGNVKLYDVFIKRQRLYAKLDFSERDGENAAVLEHAFSELGGYSAESNIALMLDALGVNQNLLTSKMIDLKSADKIKVLLAQALFGNPDNLLLDEPTNRLDKRSIIWLENYILNFSNTVVIVSHDRDFLNKICTHIVDIDYYQAKMFTGNYDFWEQTSRFAEEFRSNQNKKRDEKIKELESFIARFSANASKSSQATSRRKILEKLTIDDLPISIRKKPNILFKQKREAGSIILEVKNLSIIYNDDFFLQNASFSIKKGDRILITGNEIATTLFLEALIGNISPASGSIHWGKTITNAYFPKVVSSYFFKNDLTLVEWLKQFSEDKSENFIRSFLGRMLFSGQETLKKCNVLSGGEQVRCMLAKMMLSEANVLFFDNPTDHLDLDTIAALTESLKLFPGTILFTTNDQYFSKILTNRIFEIQDNILLDHQMN